MHPDDGDLTRYLDGELSTPALEQHLATCAECADRRSRLAEAAAIASAALQAVPARTRPATGAHRIVALARARRASRARHLMAAAAALVIATGAAAAPWSPVRRYAAKVWAAAARRLAPPQASPPALPQPADAAATGVSIAPGRGVTVDFRDAADGGRVTVRVTGRSDVAVTTAARDVRYAVTPDGVVVTAAGANAFAVEIPASAPRVVIRVRDQVVYERAGAVVTSSGTPDPTGAVTLQVNTVSRSPQ